MSESLIERTAHNRAKSFWNGLGRGSAIATVLYGTSTIAVSSTASTAFASLDLARAGFVATTVVGAAGIAINATGIIANIVSPEYTESKSARNWGRGVGFGISALAAIFMGNAVYDQLTTTDKSPQMIVAEAVGVNLTP